MSVEFETLRVRSESAVLFAEISAPPMNLLGTELVRDLVSLIQHAEADARVSIDSSRSTGSRDSSSSGSLHTRAARRRYGLLRNSATTSR